MRNKRKAKRILRAFGKEAYKTRIEYVNSFLPEKVSYVRSISYRHALRRAAIVALVLVMIMALAVTAYAAVTHYLKYTKVVHPDNDEYVANGEYESDREFTYFEPSYIPDRYSLYMLDDDQLNKYITWEYRGEENKSLTIMQFAEGTIFHIDNEKSTSRVKMIGNIEATIYDFPNEILAVTQYDNTVIVIIGGLTDKELEEIVQGMHIPE